MRDLFGKKSEQDVYLCFLFLTVMQNAQDLPGWQPREYLRGQDERRKGEAYILNESNSRRKIGDGLITEFHRSKEEFRKSSQQQPYQGSNAGGGAKLGKNFRTFDKTNKYVREITPKSEFQRVSAQINQR